MVPRTERRFEVRLPCTLAEIGEINAIARRVFGTGGITSDEHFAGVWRHNPAIALVLADRAAGRVVGYIDVYPVTEAYLDGLREGAWSEEALDATTVLAEREMVRASAIYLGGIVVDVLARGADRRLAAAAIVRAWLAYRDSVVRFSGAAVLRIGALAYTAEGRAFLQRHRFAALTRATERGRRGDYYERGGAPADARCPDRFVARWCDLTAIDRWRTRLEAAAGGAL